MAFDLDNLTATGQDISGMFVALAPGVGTIIFYLGLVTGVIGLVVAINSRIKKNV